ncbi:MAG: molybdenum ABC transporter ATP-binding protein [Acidobacteria bacterium]|nr:molybdenum ABC transporter ATP-binding protein [Acidobacteriota bacterium]MBS1867154.1 molybdenum ABC transporter ATP-binding protein [Acidobacteriota bacterium]
MEREIGPSELRVRARLARNAFQLDVDFVVPPGITILFGPSGAGKSTILDCVAGLAAPDAGEIIIGVPHAFSTKRAVNLPPESRQIAYLFQSPALFPHLTVKRNVEYGISDFLPGPRENDVREILQLFHVEHLADRKPAELSGGEAQRVALARSLVTNPNALLLDEPLSGLDAALKNSIIADLRAWNAVHEIPILYVTHDRAEVDALGERVIVIEKGKIVQQGAPNEVLNAPRKERLALASGFENILEGTVKEVRLEDGVMRVALKDSSSTVETPLTYAKQGDSVRIAIRAGDILLALEKPSNLSARNLLHGAIHSLEQRSATMICKVNAGAVFEVHVTLSAARALGLREGMELWLVLKTYSCHIVE